MDNIFRTLLVLISLLIPMISGCCITSSLDKYFGRAVISSHNLQRAGLTKDNKLFIEYDSTVRPLNSYNTKPSNEKFTYVCDISDGANSYYRKIPSKGYLIEYNNYVFAKKTTKDEIDEVDFMAREIGISKSLILNYDIRSIEYYSNTICKQTTSEIDVATEIDIIDDKTNNYVLGSKSNVIYKNYARTTNPSLYYINSNLNKNKFWSVYVENSREVEASWSYLKYPLYPFTISFDIVTWPIQLITSEPSSTYGNIFGTCPCWTGACKH